LPLNFYQRLDSESLASDSYQFVSAPTWWQEFSRYWSLRHTESWGELKDEDVSSLCQTLQAEAGVNVEVLQQEAFADILPSLDILTSMVEMNETVDMFVSLKGRAKMFLDWKRTGRKPKGLRTVKQAVNTAADARMEWRYGWRLLYYDIENAVEYFNNPVRGYILTGKSAPRRIEEGTNKVQTISHYGLFDYDVDLTSDVEYIAYVKAIVKYKLVTRNYIASPSLTLWESAKLSFVADWFVTAGDAIAAWEVIRKAEVSYSALSERVKLREKHVIGNVRNLSGCSVVQKTGEVLDTSSIKRRLPLGPPSLIPQFEIRLDTSRVLDGLTILKSKTKWK
jgi:hypothetical protein